MRSSTHVAIFLAAALMALAVASVQGQRGSRAPAAAMARAPAAAMARAPAPAAAMARAPAAAFTPSPAAGMARPPAAAMARAPAAALAPAPAAAMAPPPPPQPMRPCPSDAGEFGACVNLGIGRDRMNPADRDRCCGQIRGMPSNQAAGCLCEAALGVRFDAFNVNAVLGVCGMARVPGIVGVC
ncbi:hypothetical protein BRADI_2g18600v3 [Brachypodium distachyon]|uniref:Hydrophobic seed protein domain-containing protein n=1 Tax=Brachypodium distachyon TaxID=15368 RepID=A0A0Q3G143_BRADI|nr:hypothetical protein BRADI_2g18600v3 [Brachypodium distachyon]